METQKNPNPQMKISNLVMLSFKSCKLKPIVNIDLQSMVHLPSNAKSATVAWSEEGKRHGAKLAPRRPSRGNKERRFSCGSHCHISKSTLSWSRKIIGPVLKIDV